MKIGIVWENGVSKWMSQMFEPLLSFPDTEVNVFVGERNKFDVKDVLLPKTLLTHKEEIMLGLASLPASARRVLGAPHKKLDFYYNSLNKYLAPYDIIECHDSSRSLYTLAGLKGQGKKFKLVVSYAENIPFRQAFDDKTNYIKHSTYAAIDHFIPWCDTIKRTMLLEGVPEEKITTVYTGVDLNLFKPEAKDTGLLREMSVPENDFIILYIGKLASWKGVHLLPYAAKALLAKGRKDFTFLITGRGAQLANLKKIIAEAGVEKHFKFTGFLPYTEIRRFYNLADAFVCPSYPTMTWQEQFGMVLVEAMACGVPVIGSASGSIPEVIGSAGLTFTPGEFFELTEKIILLMDNQGLKKELGEKGRKRACLLFDASKNAAKIYDVYKKVLQKID
ncbi:glycosyltransferase family 1 protein [bacterium]|nr:MAG: glycosyltransferase family 1 protein [bacterium]